MKKYPISAVILTRNEAAMIQNCLLGLQWCQELLVIDSQSSDQTPKLAQRHGATVITTQEQSFAKRRQLALKHVHQPWILYVDADERVTPELAHEIISCTAHSEAQAYTCKRQNIFFGHTMTAGGWQHDAVTRLFQTTALTGWSGEVHESPQFAGEAAQLEHPLIHFSHRDVVSGLYKTISWTPIEAKLLAQELAKPVSFFTIVRKGLGEFWRRTILNRGWRDGQPGLIEALIQAINRMLVYIQVWEQQANPPIAASYQQYEAQLSQAWEKALRDGI